MEISNWFSSYVWYPPIGAHIYYWLSLVSSDRFSTYVCNLLLVHTFCGILLLVLKFYVVASYWRTHCMVISYWCSNFVWWPPIGVHIDW